MLSFLDLLMWSKLGALLCLLPMLTNAASTHKTPTGISLLNSTHQQSFGSPSDESSMSEFQIPDVENCTIPSWPKDRWEYDGPQSHPFPKPENSASPPFDPNLNTTGSSSLSSPRVINSIPGLDGNENSSSRSSDRRSKFCFQVRNLVFDIPPNPSSGFIRTRPVTIGDETMKYWLIWDTEGPITITAWLRDARSGLYEKETVEEDPGPVTGSRSWQGFPKMRILLDVGVSPQGGQGEISLFAFRMPK